jgi:choline dehydrogenase-like flavoprotein
LRIVDINELEAGSALEADVGIVGAGAAGITLAFELDGAPLTVCLIESGSYGPDEETQALYELTIAGHPVRQNFMSRARYFGGTCNIWAGRSMRLTPLDVAPREWIPNSGWPIPYEELARYYPRASAVLKLPSFDAFERLAARRMSRFERQLFATADLQTNASVWAKKPLRFAQSYRRQLQRSRNVRVCLNANVTEIHLNGAGTRVDACTAYSLGGKELRLKAKWFVLACGGLETARLLLASQSVQANGIGNEFDVVGRYYMDHPRGVFGNVRLSRPQRLPWLLGMPVSAGMGQVGIQLSADIQRREGLLNNYLTLERHWSERAAQAYQSFVHSMKILLRKGYAGKRFTLTRSQLAVVPELIYLLAPRELLPHFAYSAAKKVRRALSRGDTDLMVVNHCEQIPNPQSRVYLGATRDRFNMPRLVLDWRIGREETDTLMRLHALVDTQLRESQLGRLDSCFEGLTAPRYTDASHHIGTARMSTDPRTGVVDEQCKVHGVGNLFIAGSAVFPTSGHANPTLTIVALALRLASHLKRLSTLS